MITNSGWKDYSRGNLNYAYENFETEENGVNSRRMHGNATSVGRTSGGHSGRGNGTSSHHPRGGSPMRETRESHHPVYNGGSHHYGNGGSNGYKNGRSGGRVGGGGSRGGDSQGYPQAGPQHYTSQPSGMNIGDSRSLQRPRQSNGSSNSDKSWSGTMSDPRATYSLPRGAHAQHSAYDQAHIQESSHDFYYLPSQRKYSGEVVRVYVDYNKAK